MLRSNLPGVVTALLLSNAACGHVLAAGGIDTQIEADAIVVTQGGREALRAWVQRNGADAPAVEHPEELRTAVAAIADCETVLDGWSKAGFLDEWTAAEDEIRAGLARLVDEGKALTAAPPISPGLAAMLLDTSSGSELTPEVSEFLAELRDRGVPVTVIEFEGRPGPWVTDPSVDNSRSAPSEDQILVSAERFVVASLGKLYGRLSMTPTDCYLPEQLERVRTALRIVDDRDTIVSAIYGASDLIEIECGKVGTYSRFKISADDLNEPILTALSDGPWPFGPAGLYFDRGWFYANAVWQMYSRESGEWADNLSADVADYTCGPP